MAKALSAVGDKLVGHWVHYSILPLEITWAFGLLACHKVAVKTQPSAKYCLSL